MSLDPYDDDCCHPYYEIDYAPELYKRGEDHWQRKIVFADYGLQGWVFTQEPGTILTPEQQDYAMCGGCGKEFMTEEQRDICFSAFRMGGVKALEEYLQLLGFHPRPPDADSEGH